MSAYSRSIKSSWSMPLPVYIQYYNPFTAITRLPTLTFKQVNLTKIAKKLQTLTKIDDKLRTNDSLNSIKLLNIVY